MFNFKIYNKISSIDANQWNKCAGNSNPFLSYIFFKNLEDSNSIGENTSWVPNYISVILKNDIVAFVPLFIKLDDDFANLVKLKADMSSVFKKLEREVLMYLPFNSSLSENANACTT